MPVTRRYAYFDHAAVAPLPQLTADAMTEQITDFAQNGCANWPVWRQRIENARKLAAGLLNAETSEIGIVHNTSEGICLVAEGLPWHAGDNVVVPDDEFPSNLYPWMNLRDRGVELRTVAPVDGRIDLAAIDAACDASTRIVACSWVNYANGFRNSPADLAEIAHRNGALFLLDAIQGLCAFPLDVQAAGIDFLAADGHKWMLGPEGAGILYVRQPHLALLRTTHVGWNSMRHSGDFANTAFDLKPNAGRFEAGTYNMVGTAGLAESLQLLSNIGPNSISKAVLKIGDYLCDRLHELSFKVVSNRDARYASGIISVDAGDHDPRRIQRNCLAADIVMNNRAGRLRFSPHCYNTQEDVDRVVAVLSKL